MSKPPLEFGYTNHRGEYAEREALPMFVWYGATQWHPKEQWFMHAYDMDKHDERDFAMDDMCLSRRD